jgi:tRNA-dihydrouridine synthase C
MGMRDLLPGTRPALLLAPMQAVTDLPFMRVMARFGGPDIYVTEYFRVYPNSRLDPYILRSITENPTGKPVFAQLIGQDVGELVRVARELEQYPVAGIDLNLGCPAPVVCRKEAGGGLLRTPAKIDAILGAMREAVTGRFTVKTRVGWESDAEFGDLLQVFRQHAIDGLAIHGRTVREGYQTPVHTERVREAVEAMECPVIANGNVVNVTTGQSYLERSGAAGLMIGRGAIRNPWLFDQLRAVFGALDKSPQPIGRDLLDYIEVLWEETGREMKQDYDSRKQTHKMKRYLVYLAQGLERGFEERIRRVQDEVAFFAVCREFLDNDRRVPDLPPEGSKQFCGFWELLS